MADIDFVQSGTRTELMHRKRIAVMPAIEEYVPQEQRIDRLRIELQESGKVNQHTVVQRCLHADFMQAFGIAMEVFDGVGVSLEDVRTAVDLVRYVRLALQQEVVVAVHAGYQAFAQFGGVQGVHQHHFLPLGKGSGRRKHHLKIVFVCFELGKQGAPEGYVVVTLHVGHYATAALLGIEPVGRREVGGSEVMFKGSRHCFSNFPFSIFHFPFSNSPICRSPPSRHRASLP